MRASPAGMTVRLPRRFARIGESGETAPIAKAKGSARTPADSGL